MTEKHLRARRRPKARLITIERIDPFTDGRSIVTKRLAPVARFDLVFSPPKSVSLLHALGGEETAALSTKYICQRGRRRSPTWRTRRV